MKTRAATQRLTAVALSMLITLVAACADTPAATGASDAAQTGPGACDRARFVALYAALQRDEPAAAHTIVSECRRALSETAPAGWTSFATLRSRYLIDTEDWASEVAALTVPEIDPEATFIYEYSNGFAAIRRGQQPETRAALSKMGLALQALAGRGSDPDTAYRQAMRDEIGIMLGAAEGAVNDGVRRMEKLAAVEDTLPRFEGPPSFGKPMWELLGEMYLDIVSTENARRAFEKAIERHPDRVRALQGLLTAASLSGDEAAKRSAQARIDAIRRR
jgi:hypothetical protein